MFWFGFGVGFLKTRRRILGFKLESKRLTKDSKICDDKAELRRLLCGDKPRWLSHKQKASSLLYRAKLNPPVKLFSARD